MYLISMQWFYSQIIGHTFYTGRNFKIYLRAKMSNCSFFHHFQETVKWSNYFVSIIYLLNVCPYGMGDNDTGDCIMY